MTSFVLVPFTLHVQPSELCESLHEELAPLLTILQDKGKSPPQVTPASGRPKTNLNLLSQLLDNIDASSFISDLQSESGSLAEFVAEVRSSAHFEQNYVRLLFQEYCKRKSVEKQWDTSVGECAKLHRDLMTAELSPEVRALLVAVETEEAEARAELLTAYNRFVDWVDATTPQWLEAACYLETRERAKEAAVDAAKRALGNELALKNMNALVGKTCTVTDESLRRQAIAIIEQEQEHRLKAQEEELNILRIQEEQLRRSIEENKKRREMERDEQRKVEAEFMYRSLLEQESSLQQRLLQKEEARIQREEERKLLLEHIEAEEQLLRHRLDEHVQQRQKAEEEMERMERERRDELYEHLEAEEELLRQRLQRYEAARLAEAEAARRCEEEGREVLYEHVRAEEEILRQRFERRKKEEAAAKARREQEEEERQKAALINALTVETSVMQERIRRREENNQRLQQLEEERREEQLRFLQEMEAKQKQRIQEHKQQQNHQQQYYQHASSVPQYYHDVMTLNPQSPVITTTSTTAGLWGNGAILHHPFSYAHSHNYTHTQPQPPPDCLPPYAQR